MATKVKESVGKEKRVTSSSNSHSSTTKARSSSSRPSSTPPSNPKPSSTTTTSSTEKPVPNYLKPTISSRHEEAFKPLKKHGGAHDHNNDANQQQAMLNRRRSFDKPPSASRVQSALISPGPKDRKVAARSSSFSSKTTTSSKVPGSSDRPLKSPKPAAKAQPLHSKTSTSKTTTVATSKREASSAPASNRIPPKSPDHQTRTLVNNVEAKQEAMEPLDVHDDHEQDVNEVVAEVESCSSEIDKVSPEEPKVVEDNNGHSDDAVDNGDDENDKACNLVSEEEEEEVKADHIPDVGLEETIEEKEADDDHNAQPKEEDIDQNNNVNAESHTEDEAKEDQVAEEEGKENEAAAVDETAVDENEQVGMKTVDIEKEDEVVCEGGSCDMQEGHNNNVEEAKQAEAAEAEAEASVKKPGQGGQAVSAGKKDAPAAYNDVIEETASKLLEKRKNKVKALVGAFETVIDYESK